METGHEDLVGTSFLPLRVYHKKGYPVTSPAITMRALGVVAATPDNGLGIAGIAFGATVLPITVDSGNCVGLGSQIANAITHASDHGAQVIVVDVQWGGDGPDFVHRAVTAAVQKGAVIVASYHGAGSAGIVPVWPALYPEAIATSAVSFLGHPVHRASYAYVTANYPQLGYDAALDLVAPGQRADDDVDGDGVADNIGMWTLGATGYTYDGELYNADRLSAAQVAGVAALVLSAHPEWTAAQVREALESTAYWDPGWPGADVVAEGWTNAYGKGLVDAAAAVYYPNPVP